MPSDHENQSLSIKNALIQLQNEAIERLQLELESRETQVRAEIEARAAIISLLRDYRKKNQEVKQ